MQSGEVHGLASPIQVRLATVLPFSRSSAASRMPWLPMLFVWRGFANGFAGSNQQPKAQDVQPRGDRFVPQADPGPNAGNKDRRRPGQVARIRGQAFVYGLLT